MDAEFLAEMRVRLEARAAEIRQTLEHINASTAPVSPDNAIGRLTRLDAMQAASMRQALGRDHQVELQQIAQALKCMDAGTYGICRRCEEPIAPARLLARPQALLCVTCAA